MNKLPNVTLKNLSAGVQLKCCDIAFPAGSTMFDASGDISKMDAWRDFCAESVELYGTLPFATEADSIIVSTEFSSKWGSFAFFESPLYSTTGMRIKK